MEATVTTAICVALSYVRDDLRARYALLEPVCIALSGDGVCIGDAECGPLRITSHPDSGLVVLEASPFPADTGYWNGPNVIPDHLRDGSFEASLWHDLIWTFCGDIAVQTGKSAAEILEWSNGILASAWRYYGRELYGRSESAGRRRGWLAYQICRIGAWIKRFFVRISCMALAAGLLAGCNGCANPPDWEVVESSGDIRIAYGGWAPAAGTRGQPSGAVFPDRNPEQTETAEDEIDG